ncbi:uncharacterized protein LOC143207141 [Lasioglossum baleicum]|uniref:uncharacterized protein LOC143207141 n=1 Tax=Lasioglossum baleicum TaxID=434251 RepID=UPI003FCE10D8
MVGDSPDIAGEGSVSDLGDLEGWWDNPSIVFWSFALFGCFLLNVTLLLAFLVRPSLRTISNRFVMNLTVSNLLVCAIMNPLLIIDASSPPSSTRIVGGTSIGSVCAMSEGAIAVATTSSIFSVLLIAVDQYFAVVDPLRYRARVDKLKCGILIMSTWLISIVFGSLAFFNPNPRGFWLSCDRGNNGSLASNSTFGSLTEPAVAIPKTDVGEPNATMIPAVLESMESARINDDIDLIENTTVILDAFIGESITYGFIYAMVYSIFAYILPFAAVCWIYVSIYVAAHRNSERARRSGSRPILSSASFSEEQYGGPGRLQRLQADTIDDFRKLPKISSLSSIDETSETMQPIGQVSRRRSFSPPLEIEVSAPVDNDQPSSGIVFTVGSHRVEISSENVNRDIKAGSDEDADSCLEKPDGRSLEDATESSRPVTWNSKNFVENSDSEDDARFDCYESLDVLGNDGFRYNGKLSSPFCGFRPSPKSEIGEEREDQVDGRLEKNESKLDECCAEDETKRRPNQPHPCIEQDKSTTVFARGEVGPSRCNSSSTICNKTEREAAGCNNATELSACLLAPIVTITPAPSKSEALHRVSSVRSTASYISLLKDRISNGSIFRHREETRAARISALVIVMGLICWSPYAILLVMNNLPRPTDQHLPRKYDALASSFLILAAYISPLLFGYRSRRVKRELRRFFCFRRELSYKNNRSLMAKKVLKRRHSSTLSHLEVDHKYNIFNCMYGRNRWPKEKVQFVQVPETALAVETCRSSFSSGASTQISSTSTDEC